MVKNIPKEHLISEIAFKMALLEKLLETILIIQLMKRISLCVRHFDNTEL